MVEPKSWTWVTPTSSSMVVPSGTGTSSTAIRLRLADMWVRQTEGGEIFKCYRFLLWALKDVAHLRWAESSTFDS
jgi:hypothetical protein